jgi:threonine dehydrogenase-like Zn-dependent dehydrogenase
LQLSPYELFRRDLRVVATFAINRTFQEAIAMIEGGVVDVKPLVSHTVPLTDFEAGLDLAENDPDRMKVQFDVAGS